MQTFDEFLNEADVPPVPLTPQEQQLKLKTDLATIEKLKVAIAALLASYTTIPVKFSGNNLTVAIPDIKKKVNISIS